LLDFMGIRLDSVRADGAEFRINLVTPDRNERFVVELSNGTLTNIAGYQAKEADLTLTIDRQDLDAIILGRTKLAALLESGKARAEGDTSVIPTLLSLQVDFDPRFSMVPGAGNPVKRPHRANPFAP
ncbi:MAG: alkyl sulfatase C-terminal domain-containing protein, partial [Myxococcota bacterium]